MAAKKLWVEAYRPKTLDGYVFQNEQQREQINRFVLERDIPHLLLTGIQGSGKTTLAEILISELGLDDADVLRVNASNKTGVDFIRDEVLIFASTQTMGSKFKIIKLEEFDRMSPAAQDMLRAVMEENSMTCRFICTANHEHMIRPALKSRMQHLRFKAPSKDEVTVRAAEVLAGENIDFDLDILEKYVAQAYPDIRKIINNLQLNSINGKLGNPSADADGEDYQFKLLDLIAAGSLRDIRKLVSEQCSPEQLTEVYEFLYRNLDRHPKLKNRNAYEQALVVLAEGMYKHTMVAIPHLNFEATCIKLFGVTGE